MRVFGMVAVLALAGCVPQQGQDSVASGRAMFMENCAACHGDDAKGDGPLAASLAKAPANLTTLAARHGGTFPRDYVMSTIDGYRRGQHFSAAMPQFGEGDLGPIVMVGNANGTTTPTPAKLLALADYLQSIQQKP
ncbi:MAG: c-type cytochrome [Limimaricola sp.]|uniref:c-type cytochrome n=1 Tax=Limimaricola sp. TaxID=2211665 RepID=UPI001E1AB90D|nr:cytochrome c [Limimaricola sp.]MBI1416371.1 c-type cytochrome [Limimaricola sp.]